MLEGIAKWIAGVVAVTVAPFAQVGDAVTPPPTEPMSPPVITEPAPTNPFDVQGNVPLSPDEGQMVPPPADNRMPPPMPPQDFRGNDTGPRDRPFDAENQYQNARPEGQFTQGENMMSGRQVPRMQMGGEEQMIKRLEKLIVQLKAKGITVPSTVSGKLETYKSAVNSAKSAEGEAVEEARFAVDDARDGVMDLEPTLRMLGQWPQIQKQAERGITMIKKQLTSARKRALTAKVDVSKYVTKVEETIAAMEKQMSDAKTAVVAGDVEEAMEMLREVQPDEDIGYHIRMIEMASQMSKMSGQITKEIKKLETKLTVLAKKKNPDTDARYDVAHLRELIAEMKKVAVDVKARVDAGEDPDEVMLAADEGMGLFEEFMQEYAELTGEEYNGPMRKDRMGDSLMGPDLGGGIQRGFGGTQNFGPMSQQRGF